MSEPQVASPDLAIETHSLTRRFGAQLAVDSIDLRVPRGSFYGFLGENGAGKSTTISMLTGLLAPSAGSMRVLGRDLSGDAAGIKRRLGVVPDATWSGARRLAAGNCAPGTRRCRLPRRSPPMLGAGPVHRTADRRPRTCGD